MLTQSETTCQQLQATSDLREADYNTAVRSRDEALRDAKTLAARVESLEEVIKQQVCCYYILKLLNFFHELCNQGLVVCNIHSGST